MPRVALHPRGAVHRRHVARVSRSAPELCSRVKGDLDIMARNKRATGTADSRGGSSSDRSAAAGEAPDRHYDAQTERALKLWVVLSRSRASVAVHAEREIARHDLTPGEFAILEALYHLGPLLLGDVQRRILVSSGGVTYLVDRLESAGLVERRDCPGDRRARYAALTARGEALLGRIFPEHAAAIVDAVSGLTAAEQKTAIRLLKKLGLAARGD